LSLKRRVTSGLPKEIMDIIHYILGLLVFFKKKKWLTSVPKNRRRVKNIISP